jgi:hypothetical protein
MSQLDEKGFVYFVYEEGNQCYFNIGYTTQEAVEDQLKTLQTGNRRKLIIYKRIASNNAYRLKQDIHHIFRNERERGDWFSIDIGNINRLLLHLSLRLINFKRFNVVKKLSPI